MTTRFDNESSSGRLHQIGVVLIVGSKQQNGIIGKFSAKSKRLKAKKTTCYTNTKKINNKKIVKKLDWNKLVAVAAAAGKKAAGHRQ